MAARAISLVVLVTTALGCSSSESPPRVDASIDAFTDRGPDVPVAVATSRCPPAPRGCDLPPGRYLPVVLGAMQRVFVPADTRYLNDHTLVRGDDNLWHVYGITARASQGIAGQRQFLHGTAPELMGPWTERPDILVLAPDEPSRTSAPHVVREAGEWLMFWYHNVQDGGRLARSRDLSTWTRDPRPVPGSRDQFAMRLDDGRWLLYTSWISQEADGIHDAVALYESTSATDWSGARLSLALRNPAVCRTNDCWGWYESPFVVELGGYFYLFVTFTSSAPSHYDRTWVYRSRDPRRFDPEPITELRAHAGEVVRDGDRMYLSSAGWPWIIGEERRGLMLAQLGWVPAP